MTARDKLTAAIQDYVAEVDGKLPAESEFGKDDLKALAAWSVSMRLSELTRAAELVLQSARRMGSSGKQTAVLTSALQLLETEVERANSELPSGTS